MHILQHLERQFVSTQVFALTHFLFTSAASFLSTCWRKQHAVNSAGQMWSKETTDGIKDTNRTWKCAFSNSALST